MHYCWKHTVHIPAICQIIVSQIFHLRLWLHNIYNRWKLFNLRTTFDHRLKIINFCVFRCQFFYTLSDELCKFMSCSSKCIILLLLLMLLKILIRICYEYNIVQITEVCIFLPFTTHVDQSILETSPVFSDYEYAAVL